MVLLTTVVSHAYLTVSSQKQILMCCDESLKFFPDGSLNIETGLPSEREREVNSSQYILIILL